MEKEALVGRLSRYPEIKTRVEQLLEVIENTKGDLKVADDAEERVVEELRQMGSEVLHGWATNQALKEETALERRGITGRKDIKKNYAGTQSTEK